MSVHVCASKVWCGSSGWSLCGVHLCIHLCMPVCMRLCVCASACVCACLCACACLCLCVSACASLHKSSVSASIPYRDSPVRQTARPHSPSLEANHRLPTLSGATLGPSGDPAVRRATSSLALEKASSAKHWRRTSVLSDGASMKEEAEGKLQVNIAEVKSSRQAAG